MQIREDDNMRLRNSQYAAIMREYDKRQAADRHLQNERWLRVSKKAPRYEALREQLNSLCASRARSAILGTEESEKAFQQKASSLERQMRQALEEAGFPGDYLEMTYTCPDCRDTGYIGNEKCHCFRQAIVDLLYDQSGLKDIVKEENFSTFCLDYYSDQVDRDYGISPRENIKNTLRLCHEFIDNFDQAHDNLLFYGNTGVGKTFLTNCIARELLETSHTVIYLTAQELVSIFRGHTFGSRDDRETEDDMADYIFTCDLLIIDDLGSEMSNAFVNSELFQCISRRLAAHVSTIISTNLRVSDLQDTYSDRIFSRIAGNFKMLPIIGQDIRIRKVLA